MNIGKKSEFISRKYFEEAVCTSNQRFISDNMNKYILVTTTSCPKCPKIKEALKEKLKENLVVIDETTDGFQIVADQYGITQAPTLIDIDNEKVVEYEMFL